MVLEEQQVIQELLHFIIVEPEEVVQDFIMVFLSLWWQVQVAVDHTKVLVVQGVVLLVLMVGDQVLEVEVHRLQ
jgi:hypothetical protein